MDANKYQSSYGARYAVVPVSKNKSVSYGARYAIDLFSDPRILAITSPLSDDKQSLALEVLRLLNISNNNSLSQSWT